MKHSEGFLKIVDHAKTRIKEVTVADTRDRLAAQSGARLIDVREDDEWRRGPPGASRKVWQGVLGPGAAGRAPASNDRQCFCFVAGGRAGAGPDGVSGTSHSDFVATS